MTSLMSNLQVYKFCNVQDINANHGYHAMAATASLGLAWIEKSKFLVRENSLFFFPRDSVLNHSPKLCVNMKVNSAVTIHGTFMRVCLHYIVYFSIAIFPTIGVLANVLLHAIELSGQNYKNTQINQLWKSENQSFYIHGTVLEPWFRDTIIFWAALIEAFAWTIKNPVVLVRCYA